MSHPRVKRARAGWSAISRSTPTRPANASGQNPNGGIDRHSATPDATHPASVVQREVGPGTAEMMAAGRAGTESGHEEGGDVAAGYPACVVRTGA